MARIDAFLKLGREQGCSDLHFAVDVPPLLRIHGDLRAVRFRDLGEAELQQYLDEILSPPQKARLKSGEDLDFSYLATGVGRFRANVFCKFGGLGACFRYIPSEAPRLASLGMPAIVEQMTHHRNGLILVTGATGTGKSTTLAAMIDHLNQTLRANIITLEDPIEFVHQSKRSQVVQREVGTHVRSFADGLRAALREDPDIILVGELRDMDTIAMAMMAAETGHLVLGTLHTTSATKTIDRIIDALPAEQREQAKVFLAQSLRGVITQVLVKTADGHGRRCLQEVLVMNSAIGRLITSDKVFQIPAQLQTGRAQGMQLLDQVLMEAVQAKEIDPNEAYRHAKDKRSFAPFATDRVLVSETAS